jgi:hypothetical protein
MEGFRFNICLLQTDVKWLAILFGFAVYWEEAACFTAGGQESTE